MLKYQLMIDLAIELFCKFQISTQTIAKLELNNALIMWGSKVRAISLKMCICWIASITTLEMINWLVFSIK